MMAQFTLVLVAALFIDTLSYCSAENVYCVRPTATSCSSCPHNSANCTTLSEYAQEAELYFTSNTTMMFLPGDHVLDRNITVANVTRLTMRGESSSGNRATVVCNGSFFLIFTSMVDLKIHLLDFTSFTSHALSLQSAQRTELVNCSFHGNHGTALVVNNTDITLAGNIEFKRNHVRHRRRKQFHFEGAEHNIHCNTAICTACMNINKVSRVKYWVYAVGSNLTFTGNATFLGNSAGIVADHDNSGGAIYTQYSVLSFSGTTNFINNSASESDGAWSNLHFCRYYLLQWNHQLYQQLSSCWWSNLHIRST